MEPYGGLIETFQTLSKIEKSFEKGVVDTLIHKFDKISRDIRKRTFEPFRILISPIAYRIW